MLRLKEDIERLTAQAITKRVFPGCCVGVILPDRNLVLPFGRFSYEESSLKVTEDTVYDTASITKAIPTSSLALCLIEEKKLSLSDQLIQHVPEYIGSYRDEIMIKHLLNQTLVFPFSLSAFKNESADKILDHIFHAKLTIKPGGRYCSTNATSILLGMVIERVTGKTLDVVADQYFFLPLRMRRTTFHPERFPKATFPPAEIDENGGILQGVVHDESARVLSQEKPVGSAGLFSTVPDLLSFLQVLVSGGALHNQHFFQQPTIAMMCLGLGWEKNQPWMGKKYSQKAFGKTGFTGCFVYCDMEKKVGIVFLSNHTYPRRSKDRSTISTFRSDLIDTILNSLS